MTITKHFWKSLLLSLGLILLILDTKTAVAGALEGINLCTNSIIPVLLPFCVLSKCINASLLGKSIPFLRPIGKLCGIPSGAESLLVLSFLGGYPVGAQCVSDAYRKGGISLTDAQRLLAFCNNAGPAFLFGILGGLFPRVGAIWVLLTIHILSAILVGAVLPGKSAQDCRLNGQAASFPKIIEESAKTMAVVCVWVILFRIVLYFCQRWFLWLLPEGVQIILAGILELSNGCISLYSVPWDGLRFILATGFLSFGGICVAMQTSSVTKDIPDNLYFPGKCMQTCISLLLAGITHYFLFPKDQWISIPAWFWLCFSGILAGVFLWISKPKKVVAFVK